MTVRILLAKQIESATNANWTVVLSGGNAPVSGRKLYLATPTWNGVGATVVGVTDDKGSTWTRKDDSTAVNNSRALIWGCDYAGSGTLTISVDCASAGAGIYGLASVIEVDDLISSENDTGARASAAGNTSGVDGSVTGAGNTAQARNLILALISVAHGSNPSGVTTPSSGYTFITDEQDGSANQSVSFAYKYISAIETPVATWSYVDTSASWQAVIVALKRTAAAGGAAKSGMLMGVG